MEIKMIKRFFISLTVLLIAFGSVKVFAFDSIENSSNFLNSLFFCNPYTEIMSIRFYNKMYTVKKQILGKDNDGDRCFYKETWTEDKSNKPKTISCQFTPAQVTSIVAPNNAYPTSLETMVYPMANDKRMIYSYINDSNVCKVTN